MVQIPNSKRIFYLTVFSLIPIVFLLILFSTIPSSPGNGFGGGYGGDCGSCHGGESSTIEIELAGFPVDENDTSLYNGTVTYNLMVTVTDSAISSSTGGVWIIVDKGTLSTSDANLKLAGADLVQSSHGATSWNFTWVAPAEGSGWVLFTVYGMADNDDGAVSEDFWGSKFFQVAEFGGDEPPPPPPVVEEVDWWRFDLRIEDWTEYIGDELELSDFLLLVLFVPIIAIGFYLRNWLLSFFAIIGAVAVLCYMIPDFMSDIVFDIMPLITLAVLIVGVPIRVSKWVSGPKTVAIRPDSLGKWLLIAIYAIENLLLDLVFFRRIFRRDKKLWGMVWPMHATAVLLILSGIHHKVHGYAFGIAESPGVPVRQLINTGIHVPGLEFSEELTLIISLIFVGELIILTLRRKMVGKVSLITKPDVYLDLLVLIFLGCLGIIMFFAEGPYNACTLDVFGQTLEFTGILTLHAFFALLYFLSIPFTFYTHIFGGAIISAVSDGLRRAQLET